MTGTAALPPPFVALEPFVDRWAVHGSDSRMRRRIDSEPYERQEFYLAAREFLVPALEYLDTRPLEALTLAESRLLDLVLTLAHVSLAVEYQQEAEAHHAREQAHFTIERGSEDFALPVPLPTATR